MLAAMLAGTAGTWNLPNVMSSTTCDTMVEITETPAYLISFTLDGCAMIWRTRVTSGSSDDQMCASGRCSLLSGGPPLGTPTPRSATKTPVRKWHAAHPSPSSNWAPVNRLGTRCAHPIGPGHFAEPVRAGLGPSRERAWRHGHQAELRPVAEVPLEVVEQAPDEVPP